MAKNTSITLGEHVDGFTNNQIESSRYSSASEVNMIGVIAELITYYRHAVNTSM